MDLRMAEGIRNAKVFYQFRARRNFGWRFDIPELTMTYMVLVKYIELLIQRSSRPELIHLVAELKEVNRGVPVDSVKMWAPAHSGSLSREASLLRNALPSNLSWRTKRENPSHYSINHVAMVHDERYNAPPKIPQKGLPEDAEEGGSNSGTPIRPPRRPKPGLAQQASSHGKTANPPTPLEQSNPAAPSGSRKKQPSISDDHFWNAVPQYMDYPITGGSNIRSPWIIRRRLTSYSSVGSTSKITQSDRREEARIFAVDSADPTVPDSRCRVIFRRVGKMKKRNRSYPFRRRKGPQTKPGSDDDEDDEDDEEEDGGVSDSDLNSPPPSHILKGRRAAAENLNRGNGRGADW
ncbi:hypothetical protein BJ322DRAFT_1016854 [Thelephora terrestris]|uniref:Uncharacterized protein n=1 Tax=Thelephora terrestris TaxID=56493 RepID=A0A9P6HRC3_9AGAM|nr:hypothetical protein BJ322DRAFT_1016854 [Thelephora terrestris]